MLDHYARQGHVASRGVGEGGWYNSAGRGDTLPGWSEVKREGVRRVQCKQTEGNIPLEHFRINPETGDGIDIGPR